MYCIVQMVGTQQTSREYVWAKYALPGREIQNWFGGHWRRVRILEVLGAAS